MEKKMYFDDEHVTDLILNTYIPSLKYDEEGNLIDSDKKAEKEIIDNLLLIANAIINKYGLWRFGETAELQNEAVMECWRYIPNFNPDKGSCFNLFSLICKYHLISITKKDKKNRLNADIDICPDLESREPTNYDLFFDSLETELFNIVEDHFKDDEEKYNKYLDLVSILMEYLRNNKVVVGKKDLYSAFKEYGYKNSDYKKFIADIEPYKDQLYEIAKS